MACLMYFLEELLIQQSQIRIFRSLDQMTQINKMEPLEKEQKQIISYIFLEQLPQSSFRDKLAILLIEKIKEKLTLPFENEHAKNQEYQQLYQNSIKYLCYDLIQLVDILENELEATQVSTQTAHQNERQIQSNIKKRMFQTNISGKKSLKSDQQSLLDDLNSKQSQINFIPQNQMVEIHTIKKERPFTSVQSKITPLKSFNQLAQIANRRSSQIYQLDNRNVEDQFFDEKLNNLKEEINLLKSIISVNDAEDIIQSRISTSQVFTYNIKSIQVDQSKYSEQHLINQNNQLRAIIKQLKNDLRIIIPSLLEIKADLTQCLKFEIL